jgi:hypothetical protein
VYAQERYKSVQKIYEFKFLWLTGEEIMWKRIQKAEKSAKEENCRAAKGGYKEHLQHNNLVQDKIKNLGYYNPAKTRRCSWLKKEKKKKKRKKMEKGCRRKTTKRTTKITEQKI